VSVTVRFFAAARAAAGVNEITLDSSSAMHILDQAVALQPKLGQVLPQCSYLLDEVSLRDLSVAVKDGSTLDVLPPFAGG
jgi:molybdopterin converting factor small subunit